jgi:peptide/nickel transport system permease protein
MLVLREKEESLPREITPDKKAGRHGAALLRMASRNPVAACGAVLLTLIILLAVIAPIAGTVDPDAINPVMRLRPPNPEQWFGTDSVGRDLYSRILFGTRVSLVIGISVAVLSTAFGLLIGLLAGYSRLLDALFMRIMDGLMAVPPILLAIALMALSGASVRNVIIAITVAEVPRVTRLVRGVVLTLRDQPFVEAAHAAGTRSWRILYLHILPNTVAPLIVQATYVCASAMIIEAILSFLGAGAPPTVPSWGNIIAEGRALFLVAPYIVIIPSLFLSITVLAVNLLGDGMRDALDPRLANRM